MPAYRYARERLSVAVHRLATGPGDARSRLIDAFVAAHTLTEHDFPPELRPDWKWVIEHLTVEKPHVNHRGEVVRSSVEMTVRKRRNVTASRIAEKIWELRESLRRMSDTD